MRLGIYGGSFDPIHQAHLVVAESCREACQLDQVWFLPAGQPPHKTGIQLTAGKHRLAMLELAVAGYPEFRVNSRELDREGVGYTVTTLEELHQEDPTRELFFIMGGDSLQDFPTWRQPERIVELAHIVAVNRGSKPLEVPDTFGERLRQRTQVVTIPRWDLSSTEIRRRVAQGKSIRFLTPRPVQLYIQEHRLYRES